jgi:hypothetical protein
MWPNFGLLETQFRASEWKFTDALECDFIRRVANPLSAIKPTPVSRSAKNTRLYAK